MNVSATENTKLDKFKELVGKVKSNIYNLALADEDIKKLQALAKDYLGEVHKSPIWGGNNFTLYNYQSQVGTVAVSTNKKDRYILYSNGQHWNKKNDKGFIQYDILNNINEKIGIIPIPFFREIFYEKSQKCRINLILSSQKNKNYAFKDNDITVIYMPDKDDLIDVLSNKQNVDGGSIVSDSTLLGDYKIGSKTTEWQTEVFNCLKELHDVEANEQLINNFLSNERIKNYIFSLFEIGSNTEIKASNFNEIKNAVIVAVVYLINDLPFELFVSYENIKDDTDKSLVEYGVMMYGFKGNEKIHNDRITQIITINSKNILREIVSCEMHIDKS